jgi:nucleoside-diphosphate-sugar epimerase
MKKILIVGAAGFLMSNFIRYILYRSKKEFEIVSIDILNKEQDVKNIYLHRHNKFYVGDVTNENFLYNIIKIEKPDIIINGVGSGPIYSVKDIHNHAKLLLDSAYNLSQFRIPVIQISQPEESDTYKIYSAPNKAILSVYDKNNVVLEVPNCFGPRQKPIMGLGKIISSVMKGHGGFQYEEKWPWTYVDDLSSMIWYIIETEKTGKIKMPPLGMVSLKDLTNIIEEVLEVPHYDKEVITEYLEPYKASLSWAPKCTDYSPFNIGGWVPDSKDLKSSIIKTVMWYSANKWIMKGY